jgi:hypothetical protein
LSKQEIRIVV